MSRRAERRWRPEARLLRRLPAGLLATLLALRPGLAAAEQAIAYEPAVVTLSGTLHGGTFEHPNGQRVPFWSLRLREPVRAAADPVNPVNAAVAGVKEVQVYPHDPALMRQLQRGVGRQVALAGVVFHQHTAWHVRELVMEVASVRIEASR